jgi:hypothetical protein
MGTLVMVSPYITGRLNDRGEAIFEGAAHRLGAGRPGTARWLGPVAAGAGSVITIHVAYALSMAPHLLTKVPGLQTTTSSEPLFEEIPLPPR